MDKNTSLDNARSASLNIRASSVNENQTINNQKAVVKDIIMALSRISDVGTLYETT